MRYPRMFYPDVSRLNPNNGRRLTATLEEIQRLRELYGKAKSNTQRNRISTMVSYFTGMHYRDLGRTPTTVKNIIKRYRMNKETFHTTNFKGRSKSTSNALLVNQIVKIMKQVILNGHTYTPMKLYKAYRAGNINLDTDNTTIISYKRIWSAYHTAMKSIISKFPEDKKYKLLENYRGYIIKHYGINSIGNSNGTLIDISIPFKKIPRKKCILTLAENPGACVPILQEEPGGVHPGE